MAQIETTIKLEMEAAKLSWADMFRTAGMRRRTLIASAMGLFTQWSGNTLISFYLSQILSMIGYTDAWTNTRINLGLTAWSFINGTSIALISPRFKRRTMFLTCSISMLVVYIAWTISMQQAMDAYNNHTNNAAAGIITLTLIFLYSPCYNIGNNALAYSKFIQRSMNYWEHSFNTCFQPTWWNSFHMPKDLAVSQSSSSGSAEQVSSPPLSTLSGWPTRAGST
jgi:hypothetical protein